MGYDNFGFKIGLEGEKEFKNALRDINQSFKVLGSEMNLISSQFDKNNQSVKALHNAATSFGESDKRTQLAGYYK